MPSLYCRLSFSMLMILFSFSFLFAIVAMSCPSDDGDARQMRDARITRDGWRR
jgi:hypothetical protein